MAEEVIDRESKENETIVYWMFKKTLKLEVNKLDKDTGGRRPDFHVFEKGKEIGIICEVKSFFSAGEGISTYVAGNIKTSDGPFIYDPWPKLWSVLSDASEQYRILIQDRQAFSGTPFVVCLFFNEQFADIWNLIPRNLVDYPRISGLIRVEKSKEQSEFFSAMPLEQLKELIIGNVQMQIPEPTKKFVLLRNTAAQKPVSDKWFGNYFEV